MAASPRPAGMPESMPWPPPRPPPLDFSAAVAEHNEGRKAPLPFQVWHHEPKVGDVEVRTLMGQFHTAADALAARDELGGREKGYKVWPWPRGKELVNITDLQP